MNREKFVDIRYEIIPAPPNVWAIWTDDNNYWMMPVWGFLVEISVLEQEGDITTRRPMVFVDVISGHFYEGCEELGPRNQIVYVGYKEDVEKELKRLKSNGGDL